MKKLIPVLLLFFAFNIYSQKEANFWYFGRNAGIDFNSGTPLANTDGTLNTLEGCSSFADADGNLLFYSDGSKVYNKDHNLMTYTNGNPADNLKGNPSSTQSGMIIPKPGSNSIYYLFTVGDNFNPAFDLYTVDMSLNSGKGQLIDEDDDGIFFEDLAEQAPANKNFWTEKIAAVRGNECNSFWVVSKVSNFFYSYKVDENGVNTTPIISSVSNTTINSRGYLKLSPNGEKLAIANQNSTNDVIVYSFDNDSGIVSNDGTSILNNFLDGQAYGVEFSSSSEKLYISSVSGFRDNLSESETTYKLFQFDLTVANIAASKALIHEQVGFRGALQLGPNGKIYATIPLAYDDASGDATFLSAIENPNANAADIIFTEEAVNLGGKKATQGLPPFISSLLLPIEITDTATNEIVNNQNLQFCIGQDKLIKPAAVSGTDINYEWSFNNGTSTTEISSSPTTTDLTLIDLKRTDTGTYNLKITLKDTCDNDIEYNGTFNIEVFEAASATEPVNINSCDEDLNGSNTFDLQNNTALKDKILTGLDASSFEILYFDDSDKANDNIAGTNLPNPYNLNTGSTRTIYARVQNRNAPNACPAFTTFTIAVTGFPVPETPTDFPLCDNTYVGSDTDGFIDDFILENKDAEILGDDLNAAQYIVSYHTTPSGAETSATSDVIPKTANYTNTTANTQPIYVRVENRNNAACFDASKTFNLIVNALPILKTNPELEYCLSATNTNPTVNLTLAELNISNNYQNELFKYYEDEFGVDEIKTPTEYPVTSNTRKSVYVQVFNQATLCSRNIIELILNIATEGDNNYDDTQTPVCDDFTGIEGSDTDKITSFSLNKTAIINSINPPANTNIFFYESINNRANSLDEINITNYRNKELSSRNDITTVTNGIQFPVYYKILSTINNNCQGLGQFYLQINAIPNATQAKDMQLCDSANDGDATNGIVQNFDLESQTPIILGTQNVTEYAVTYHLSKADASSGNAPETSPFANTKRYLQTIYVRVTNNNTGCFTDRTSFDLIVNPLPIANFVPDIEICDDPSDGSARNGFSQTIDLESQTDGILGTQDPAIYSVTYHHSLGEAQSGNNILVSPYSNETPNRETIYVRTYNSSTSCANGISNFDVLINPEPTFTNVSNLSYCDNDLDGDDTNGIIQNIDLENQIPLLLGTSQDPDDYNVSFHNSQAGASSGSLPIASPYTNINTLETMYVRIQNKATSCVNDDATFDVIVNTLPNFTVTSPQILCLNDTPKNITIENPFAIYSYVWRDVDGNTIDEDDNLNVTGGGNYTVTATTTNGTDCSRTKTIAVTESSPAILLNSFVTIVDEANTLGSENNLSISIDTISNDLGPGDYQFAILNTDDNTRTPFVGFQDQPLFENLEGGIYNIIVNDKNGCAPDATLQISVLQFPKFFTPNGDGKNDTWLIKGANKTFYPNSSINIFNRFGKLVAQIPIDGDGWNGTYNGKKLSSDDYWYTITFIPADLTKPTINKKGNFSLIRK